MAKKTLKEKLKEIEEETRNRANASLGNAEESSNQLIVADEDDKSKIVVCIKSAAVILALIGVGYTLGNCGKAKHERKIQTSEEPTETVEDEYYEEEYDFDEELNEENVNDYNNTADLINNSNINGDKRKVLSAVWSYLSYYNETVAKHYSDVNSSAMLSLAWDEAVAQYFAYNQDAVTKSTIENVFDGYDVSTDELMNAYSTSYDADFDAFHILGEGTNKEAILSDTAQSLYLKYENIINKFNNCGNSDGDNYLKQSLVDEFYSELRSDFNISKTSISNGQYRYAILPLVSAMNEMSKDIDSEYKLSKKEKKVFNDRDEVNDVMSDLFIKVSDYSDGVYLDEEFTYLDIKNFAIQELTDNNAYNIDNRNVSEYSIYQDSLNQTIEIEEEETTEEKEDNNTQITEYDTNTNDDADTSTDESTELDKDDVSDKIPDWMLEEETQEEINTNDESIDTQEPFIDEDVPEVEKDTPDFGDSKSNDRFQKYCDMLATMIVDSMSQEKIVEKSKQMVKSI